MTMKTWQKTLLITTLLLLCTAGLGAAQRGKTAILVSDNVADSAVAEVIGNVKHVEVFTTPWGEYNESVVQNITAFDPVKIFIIGGPVAVPSEYETALQSYTVIRISGKDRYETAAAALQFFKNDFAGRGIAVAYGYDGRGIKKALEKARGRGWFVLFVKEDDVPSAVEAALNSTEPLALVVFDSPSTKPEKLLKKLNKTRKKVEHHGMNESEKAERAWEEIEDAREEIAEAEKEIAEHNITDQAVSTLLEQAKRHLENAEKAYANESYGQAFGEAISAKHAAENAKRYAKHEEKRLHLGSTKKDGREKEKHEKEEKKHEEEEPEELKLYSANTTQAAIALAVTVPGTDIQIGLVNLSAGPNGTFLVLQGGAVLSMEYRGPATTPPLEVGTDLELLPDYLVVPEEIDLDEGYVELRIEKKGS